MIQLLKNSDLNTRSTYTWLFHGVIMTIQSGFCKRNISVICPQLNIFAHFLFPFISALKEVKKMVNFLKISSVSPPFCEIFLKRDERVC